MSIELYFSPLSQPARAVQALLVIGNIPYNPHVLDLMKGETQTPEFKQISATGNVPAIVDGDLKLFESHTILKYLAKKYKLEQLYPSDIAEQAKLDQYLDWHHTGTRQITNVARSLVFGPKFLGAPIPENKDALLKELDWYLGAFEEIFLDNGKNEFILGSKSLTIADITAINELTTLFFIDADYSKHTHLFKYMKHLLSVPEIKKVHESFIGLVKAHIPNLRQEYLDLIE